VLNTEQSASSTGPVFIYLLNDKIQHGPHEDDLIPSGKLALPTRN